MTSRIENILQAMIDGTSSEDLPKAQSRNEELLKQVLDKMDGGGTTSKEVQTALLNLFRHTAYIDDQGADLITDLERAFLGVKPVRIGAVYNPPIGYVVYTDDDLDKVAAYLTVTEYYVDGSSIVVTGYTLTGTLVDGTSTLTVGYDGLATTVQVAAVDFYNQWEWRYSNGDLMKMPANMTEINKADGKHGVRYSNNASTISANNRRSFAVSRGLAPVLGYDDTPVEGVYPVPVPKTATKLTATITPPTQQFAAYVFKYVGDGDYVMVAPESISWHDGQDIVEFEADENLFVAFNCRYNNTNAAYAVEPTEFSIVYE